ncbi:hypothetical protein EIP86_009111 [Pleurotus ostreatoroseus]|nr:hypothetical protein EIP86_009111 [Pleurotus ostreatoroseus]
MSNNLGVREGVLDLVWVDPGAGCAGGLQVDDMSRHRSDHAILRWSMPLTVTPSAVPNLKRGSEEGAAYVRSCRALFNAIPLEYESREQVERTGDWLASRLDDLWNRHATVPKPTRHSRSWWSSECSDIVKETRSLREQRKALVAQRKTLQTQRAPDLTDAAWHHGIAQLSHNIAAASALIDRSTKRLRGAVRRAKRSFFDEVLQKTHPSRIWDTS